MNEPFARGDSWIFGVNPAVRLFFAFAYSCAVAVFDDFSTLMASISASCLLVAVSGLNPAEVLKRLVPLFCFLIMVWLFVPLTFGGDAVWSAGFLTFSREGVEAAARITIKSIAILAGLTVMAATMPMAVLGRAMEKLGMPSKMVWLFLTAYRYVFVFEREYKRLVTAAKVRGFVPGTNMHSYKTFAYLTGMLLVKSWERARRVQNAMLCRGFRGKFHSLAEFSTNLASVVFSAAMSVMIGLLIFLEIS